MKKQLKKQCTECKKFKTLRSFYKDSKLKCGYASKCKRCRKIYAKKYQGKLKQKYLTNLIDKAQKKKGTIVLRINKDKMRTKVIQEIAKGNIIRPTKCSICQKVNCKIEAHHHDYRKPLDVIWCCVECHHEIHKKIRRVQKTKKQFVIRNTEICRKKDIIFLEDGTGEKIFDTYEEANMLRTEMLNSVQLKRSKIFELTK